MSVRIVSADVSTQLGVTKFEERPVGPIVRGGFYQVTASNPVWVKWIPIVGPQILVLATDRFKLPAGTTLYFTAANQAADVNVSRRSRETND